MWPLTSQDPLTYSVNSNSQICPEHSPSSHLLPQPSGDGIAWVTASPLQPPAPVSPTPFLRTPLHTPQPQWPDKLQAVPCGSSCGKYSHCWRDEIKVRAATQEASTRIDQPRGRHCLPLLMELLGNTAQSVFSGRAHWPFAVCF